jgi:hypothetical protein
MREYFMAISVDRSHRVVHYDNCVEEQFDHFLTLVSNVWEAVKSFFQSMIQMIREAFGCVEIRLPHPEEINVNILSSIPSDKMVRSLRVNPERLKAAPTPIHLDSLAKLAGDMKVHGEELMTYFEQLVEGKEESSPFCRDEVGAISVYAARTLLHRTYVILDVFSNTKYEQMIAREVGLLVKGMLCELKTMKGALNNTELTADQIKEGEGKIRSIAESMLSDLARAALHCTPRKHSETLRVYRKMTNQLDTVLEILLQCIQQGKEDLFLSYYSLSAQPPHLLNFLRKELGVEFGLDRNPIHLDDPFLADHHTGSYPIYNYLGNFDKKGYHVGSSQFRATFHEIYQPAAILPLIQQALNKRISENPDLATMISQFLDGEVVKAYESTNPSKEQLAEFESKLPEPFQVSIFPRREEGEKYGYQLRMEGVEFLLTHFKILNKVA